VQPNIALVQRVVLLVNLMIPSNHISMSFDVIIELKLE
jgi:hypothetical protein